MTLLRVGLVGTGYWAATVHAVALAAHPRVELAGVWGRDPDRAAALAGPLGVPVAPSVAALIDRVDALAFAVPPQVQAGYAVAAARAGRHLLLEKPTGLDLAQAAGVADAVRAAGVASVVFLTRRYCPSVTAVLAAAAADPGWLGGRVTMLSSIFGTGSPYAGSTWRRERGGLWDLGPHALSLLVPVLGPVRRVAAVGGPAAGTHLTCVHGGGAVATVTLSLDCPPAAQHAHTVLYGASGWLTVPEPDVPAVTALAAALDELCDAAAGRPPAGPLPRCDAELGRDQVAVLCAAQDSLDRGGAPVDLPG